MTETEKEVTQTEANSAIVAAIGTITLGGNVYFLRPVTPQDLMTFEGYVAKRLKSPIQSAAEEVQGLPPALQEMVMREAVRLKSAGPVKPSTQYVTEILGSPQGLAHMIWILARDHHPDLKTSELIGLIGDDEATVQRVSDDVYRAAQWDVLKKKADSGTL